MNLIDELEREKAHSDAMKAAAEMWMQKAQDAERTIAALVHASGGLINVGREVLHIMPDLELIKQEDVANHAFTFRTRRLTTTPNKA